MPRVSSALSAGRPADRAGAVDDHINHLVMARARLCRQSCRASSRAKGRGPRAGQRAARRARARLLARGGPPAAIVRRTGIGWRLSGHRSTRRDRQSGNGTWSGPAPTRPTRASASSWCRRACRARASSRPGTITACAPAGHDVVFDDVVIPFDAEVDVRKLPGLARADTTPGDVSPLFVAAIYDGIARAAAAIGWSAPVPRFPRAWGAARDLAAERRRSSGSRRASRECAADRRFRRATSTTVSRSRPANPSIKLTGDQQRGRRGQDAPADRNHGLVSRQSAGAALSRRTVRPRAARRRTIPPASASAALRSDSRNRQETIMSIEFIGLHQQQQFVRDRGPRRSGPQSHAYRDGGEGA